MGDLRIIGLEGAASGVTVQAQFNPTEIVVVRLVDWRVQPKKGPTDLDYITTAPKAMTFELLFDGFESGIPVQPHIAKLHQLSDVDRDLKRPPKVRVSFGSDRIAGVIPKLEAVIEAVSVRYLMFNESGVALRANVMLKFKEADDLKIGKAIA